MALRPAGFASPLAYRQRADDFAWPVGAVALSQESGDFSYLGVFPRGARAGASGRRKLLLPRVSFCAGTRHGAADFSSAMELAAGPAQQVAVGGIVRRNSIYLRVIRSVVL